MINIFLLLTFLFTPLFASAESEDTRVLEMLETIFGSDLATDLEEAGLTPDEACEILKLALKAQNIDIPVAKNDVPRSPVFDTGLPADWECFFETKSHRPLIICPKNENTARRFLQVAQRNQAAIVAAIRKYGAVVFSGFDFTLEEFPVVFEAATGLPPDEYRGHVPRKQVAPHIYKSTAVSPAYHIGLHQEEATLGPEYMPQFISFYCKVPPKAGTGRTLVASAREITHSVQEKIPDLWELMNQGWTSWAFYMPDTGFWTKVTKALNPSHATVKEMFGTDDPEFIKKWCKEREYTCVFVDGGVKVYHRPIRGVIELDGELTFCNQMHLNVRNAHICGGKFNKAVADSLLYEQFGLQLSDGTPITSDQADRLSRVIKPHEDGRDWQAGEIMIYDNLRALHGKTPHKGKREVFVTLGGRVKKTP